MLNGNLLAGSEIRPARLRRTGPSRVGQPALRYLNEFGSQVWHAFGHLPYLVGSAMYTRDWKDIDIRCILPDDEYDAMFGDVRDRAMCGKRHAMEMAFSELGRKMTGLPIDFQLQQHTEANRLHDGPREAIGIVALRRAVRT